MKTYLIPTTAHVAVKLSQQLLQTSGGPSGANMDEIVGAGEEGGIVSD